MMASADCAPLKEKDLKGLVERNVHAVKGDAGRILIVGGDERYVGSAVLAGLAALRCGVDSVVIAAPEAAARLMNAFSPDLVTVKLKGPELSDDHLQAIARLAETASVVLIGPGFGVSEAREAWLAKLLPLLKKPVVLDADATKQVSLTDVHRAVLLANPKEYEALKERNGLADKKIGALLGTNVLVVKGKDDLVLCGEGHQLIEGGHVRATVAGTGDALAGVAAALYAFTEEPHVAAQAACIIGKKSAEKLGDRLGFSFLASDLVAALPEVLKELRLFRVTKHEPKPGQTPGVSLLKRFFP